MSATSGNKPYIIAECAYSHDGDLDYLKESIQEVARIGGISAVKFHVLLDLDSYIVPDHDVYEPLKKWLFAEDDWRQLVDYAKSFNLDVIMLADDVGCLSFLKSIEDNLSYVEIHAGSLNDLHMLSRIAGFNVPVMLGVSGSDIDEIKFAVDYLKKSGKDDITLMYGFQNYPTKYEYVNFKKMKKIMEIFGLPVGYADHTSWNDENQEIITLAGFLCGANIIEKHFVLKKGEKRTDYEAAISSEEFKSLCEKLSILQKAMGDGNLGLNEYEQKYGIIGPMKKAIVAGVDINSGDSVSLKNLAFKRTKKISKIQQKEALNLVGRKANKDIKSGELVTFENTSV